MKSLFFVVYIAAAFSVSAFAQTGGRAEVFPAQQIREKLTMLAAQTAESGSAGFKLADYGSHRVQISVRTLSGGAEFHPHFDDVMIVQQGTATLITGGSIIEPKLDSDGEMNGTGIRGGKSQTISAGDVVTVNAGVPHQLIIPAGTVYSALVIKVKE